MLFLKSTDKFFDNPRLAFEIAKTKSVDFKNNIDNYMFMYATENQLHFKDSFTRKYLLINY